MKILLPEEPFCEGCCSMQFPTVIIHDGNTTWCLACTDANDTIDSILMEELRKFQANAEKQFAKVQKEIQKSFTLLKKDNLLK